MSWSALGRSFDAVADIYDEVRPDYPDDVYASIERVSGAWSGARVLDVAAGSGIATRQLAARGATVVACDPGLPLLRRLRARDNRACAVAATAEHLPFRAGVFDLACCATAFHWFDAARAVDELRHVLRPRGVLALWWANHRRDDAIPWEAAQGAVHDRWSVRGGSRPPSPRGIGPRDTAAFLRSSGLDVVVDTRLTWSRVVSRETHLKVLSTHSDVIALGAASRDLLAEIGAALAPWPQVEERLWGPLVVARMP